MATDPCPDARRAGAEGLDPVDKPEFRIPIGNFTDSRFFGETEDGVIVQGFRLQYD